MAEVMLRIAKLKPTMILWQPVFTLKKLDCITQAPVRKVKIIGDKVK